MTDEEDVTAQLLRLAGAPADPVAHRPAAGVEPSRLPRQSLLSPGPEITEGRWR